MKKIMFLLPFFAFIFLDNINAQNVDYPIFPPSKERREEMAKKRLRRDSLELQLEKRIATNNIVKSGYYLQKSAYYQYGAFGCALVSASCFFASSKCDKTVDTQGNKVKSESSKAWVVFGYASAASALFCEVMSITYKLKAGKSLMIQPNPSGGVTARLKF